jgi:hypothetical protein
VEIPAWETQEEVEHGDEMGMVHASAASLGLAVEYSFAQDLPGHGHGEVLSIDPPAGSLVATGSTVRGRDTGARNRRGAVGSPAVAEEQIPRRVPSPAGCSLRRIGGLRGFAVRPRR